MMAHSDPATVFPGQNLGNLAATTVTRSASGKPNVGSPNETEIEQVFAVRASRPVTGLTTHTHLRKLRVKGIRCGIKALGHGSGVAISACDSSFGHCQSNAEHRLT